MATPRADSYTAASGGVVAGGRYALPSYGAFSAAVAGMSQNSVLNWSSSTTVAAITDTSGPGGTPCAWLESAANYTITSWPGKGTWDSARSQVIAVGTTQGYTSEVPAGTHAGAVYLDVLTGTFSKTWNPFGENIGHIYDSNCSVSMGGKIYRKPYNGSNLWKCDLTTRAWTLAKSVTALSLTPVCMLDVFPDLGASGSVVFFDDAAKLTRWDIATDALTTIGTYSGCGAYPSIHYVPGAHCVIFGGGTTSTALYKLDSAGAVTTVSSAFPAGVSGTGSSANAVLVADPSNRAKSWLFKGGTAVYSLDHASGVWTDHSVTTAPESAAIIACHGTGAILILRGSGRANSTTSLSTVHIFRVI